jgi:hypothetical protein
MREREADIEAGVAAALQSVAVDREGIGLT